MRKKNEMSLLQTEIWTLESELWKLDMLHKDRTPVEKKQWIKTKETSPKYTRGRSDHFEPEENAQLNAGQVE